MRLNNSKTQQDGETSIISNGSILIILWLVSPSNFTEFLAVISMVAVVIKRLTYVELDCNK